MIVLQIRKQGNLRVKLKTAVSYLDNKPGDNEEHLVDDVALYAISKSSTTLSKLLKQRVGLRPLLLP